jgi:hypothetical protein
MRLTGRRRSRAQSVWSKLAPSGSIAQVYAMPVKTQSCAPSLKWEPDLDEGEIAPRLVTYPLEPL